MVQALNPVLEELLNEYGPGNPPELGGMVKGQIVCIHKNKIVIDLGNGMTGIIAGKEAQDSHETLSKIEQGDPLTASVIEGENEDGYYVLSLRKASQQKTWGGFVNAYEAGDVIEVVINEANKGGLLVSVDGIKGFIPVSQLAPMHYPRVNGADSAQILSRLQKLVGKKLRVRIINVDQDGGKLILSEKAASEERRADALAELKVGTKVHGKISGIVKFGIFVAFEGLEGLVHISEIEWGHVKNPANYGKIGDEVDAVIIGIEGDKISLSMKRLTPDPWEKAAEKYTVGKVVKGTVDRVTQFGVFLKLEDDIGGLIHITELSDIPVKDPNKVVKLADEIEAKVISVDLEEHRIGLSLKAMYSVDVAEQSEALMNKETTGKSKATSKKKVSIEKTIDLSGLGLTAKLEKALQKAGYRTPADLKKVSSDDLTKLEGIGKATAEKILKKAQEL